MKTNEMLIIEDDKLKDIFVKLSIVGKNSGLTPMQFLPVVKIFLDSLADQLGVSDVQVSVGKPLAAAPNVVIDPRDEMH